MDSAQNNQDLEIAQDVLTIEASCILAAKDRLNLNFSNAVSLIYHAVLNHQKIIVTGVGKSGKIASKVAATFSSTGTPAIYLHPTEGIHGDLGIAQKNDIVVAFSHSGNTIEILSLIPNLKEKEVKIIAIVGNTKSPLAQNADVIIDASIEREACPLNLAPTSSTAVQLALGDALAMAVSVRLKFKEENFAENHPGGMLGKRLLLKVADLMHSPPPWVLTSASVLEVAQAITNSKLGAVVVRDSLDNEYAVGIITDGDLRRAFKFKEELFNKKAIDLMTKNPIKVKLQEKAITALDLMENRPSQISVLPVINEKNECVGIIRVHDIVRTI